MRIRNYLSWRTMIVPLVLALALTACGDDDNGESGTADDAATDQSTPDDTADDMVEPKDGPEITVGSFNFNESVILAEIYAQALEANGYPVERELNLGARELIFSDLQSGNIDLMPEYAASALSVGFSGEPTDDVDETIELLREQFEEFGVTVLEPASAQNANTFVVSADFAEEHDLQTISDLANVDETITFAGPPECEERETCLLGLRETYGLDNLEFESSPETLVRASSLENRSVQMALFFTTDPVLASDDLVQLEDDLGFVAAENIVPVVNNEILEAYGDDLRSLINEVTGMLDSETLVDLNARAEPGEDGSVTDPANIASEWLAEQGLI